MKIYLDDDSVNPLLVRLLLAEGHDVLIPANANTSGQEDPRHFMFAIGDGRILLTHNHRDFKLLHELVLCAGGHHPGLFVVRKDNDPKRDLSSKGIVHTLRKLIAAAIPIPDELHLLNHWR